MHFIIIAKITRIKVAYLPRTLFYKYLLSVSFRLINTSLQSVFNGKRVILPVILFKSFITGLLSRECFSCRLVFLFLSLHDLLSSLSIYLSLASGEASCLATGFSHSWIHYLEYYFSCNNQFYFFHYLKCNHLNMCSFFMFSITNVFLFYMLILSTTIPETKIPKLFQNFHRLEQNLSSFKTSKSSYKEV